MAANAGLAQSLGDATVWCCVSGDRIEKDIADVGTPRYHFINAQDINCHVSEYNMVQLVIGMLVTAVKRIGSAEAEDGAKTMSVLAKAFPRFIEDVIRAEVIKEDAISEEVVREDVIRDASPTNWVKEEAHFWHCK